MYTNWDDLCLSFLKLFKGRAWPSWCLVDPGKKLEWLLLAHRRNTHNLSCFSAHIRTNLHQYIWKESRALGLQKQSNLQFTIDIHFKYKVWQSKLSFQFNLNLLQLLITMIWLRRYPSMNHLAAQFRISVGCVHKVIHRIIPILHSYLVPKYIKWHSMNHWRRLRGTFPEWPRVVAIIDGTSFRISRPKGCYQRLFWRGDRHCFFLNWIIVIDVARYIVMSRPGFQGHLHDSTCLS